MLDVHPPHASAHSWRDFFIHIATIVIGLLIAVGLEQTVEAIHRHNERAELRESLHAETDQIIKDTTDTEDRKQIHIAWLDHRIAQLKTAMSTGQPLPPPDAFGYPPYSFADDPIWRAAKTSGQAALLPANELVAYSEVDTFAVGILAAHDREEIARDNMHSFEGSLVLGPDGNADWTRLSSTDLREYLVLLNDDRAAVQSYRNLSLRARAAEECIRRGDWALPDLVANEAKLVANAHL